MSCSAESLHPHLGAGGLFLGGYAGARPLSSRNAIRTMKYHHNQSPLLGGGAAEGRAHVCQPDLLFTATPLYLISFLMVLPELFNYAYSHAVSLYLFFPLQRALMDFWKNKKCIKYQLFSSQTHTYKAMINL